MYSYTIAYFYDLEKEDALELDKTWGDDMNHGPYFAHHEGSRFLIDVEDMPNEVREIIERHYCDTVESGIVVSLETAEDLAQARAFLTMMAYSFHSCIIHYGGYAQLLAMPTTEFLIDAIKKGLSPT